MNQINNSKKIYHAAIYVRLSKEDGDVATAGKRESNSISNQKDLIKNFLKDKKDIVVVSERVDDGYSGSNFERPAFQMMLEDIKKGIVDCVVVKDLSRFGREYIDAGKYIERLFPALGVRFIAVNDHYDSLEGKSQADEIVIPFKNLINDAYCRDISIKIRSHLEVKRKNGEYIGAFTPYGYQKDSDNKNKLVIDVYAAGIVKEIYRMKLSGMSQTAIANALNKQGVLSPMEYKHSLGIRIQDNFKTHEQAEWSAMSVKRILENEVYTGTLVQGKRTTPNHKVKKLMKKPETDWVRIEKNHKAIVSEREFALVQRLLGIDTRTSPNEEKVYPLSGLVVCGDCGAMMIKRDVPAGGKVYAYYICSRHAATKACAAHRIPMGKLEETVLEEVDIRGYDDCGNARNSGPRTNHRNYCRCSCSNYRNHSHCEKLGRYIGVVRRFMGKSEREMLTSVGINLLIFYRNDTAGMGQPGGKIPKYPGMVGWNLEPDFGFFHKRMEYDHAESCSTRNYRNHNRPLADRS